VPNKSAHLPDTSATWMLKEDAICGAARLRPDGRRHHVINLQQKSQKLVLKSSCHQNVIAGKIKIVA